MEDGRIDENMLALSIGLTTTGVYGLARAVNSEQWYRNIILHDSLYSCEQLLEFVYPELAKQNSWKLPVWYYISKSNMKSELAEEKAPHSYTEIVTESTIKRNRSAIGERTAWEVWNIIIVPLTVKEGNSFAWVYARRKNRCKSVSKYFASDIYREQQYFKFFR